MAEPSPFLVPPYSVLAGLYKRASFTTYAEEAVLRYLAHAQALDWAGRRILDLGCGVGSVSWMLAQRGYRVVGVDNTPAMVEQARAMIEQHLHETQGGTVETLPEFLLMDLRALEVPGGSADLALALGGTLNALGNLRDLEQAFASVFRALDAGRMFIFDLWTIRGLAEHFGTRDQVYYDNAFNLTIVARHQFSYETLSLTTTYLIFQQQGQVWQRQDEMHVTRAFPTQGVRALLERAGFRTLALLAPDLRPFDPLADVEGRAVFFAQKL